MNKIIISAFTALLMAIATFANAQESDATQNKVRFGFKLSPALSWMKPDFVNTPAGYNIERDGIKAGFSYGAQIEFLLSGNNLFLQTGFDIQQHNGAYKVSSTLLNYSENYRMQYIELPFIFKARTREIGYIRYYGQLGFGFSGRNRVKLTRTTEILNVKTETVFDRANDRANFFRTSMILGGGIEYSLSGSTALIAGISFNNGFTNILKKQNNTPYEERAITNFLQLNIGILF
jgi:hypothetical protein